MAIQLSFADLEILNQHKQKALSELTRDRAHALILLSKGYNGGQIEDIFDRHEKTVREWIFGFQQLGVSSVFHNYSNNKYNASKLTKEQQEEVSEILKKQIDSEGGLPKKFFDVSSLKEYINATYNVVYESVTSYYHIFEVSNFSFKLPDFVNKRRGSEESIQKRMLEIQRIIEDYLKKGYEVFFADECSLSFETEQRRLWLPKGQKTVMKVNKLQKRQSYFGAWNILSKVCSLIKIDWQNTETIIFALEELTKLYKDKKLLIIWDNAGWHKSKELKALLGEGNKFSHIHLEWLPPYCPDHNPQEHIWKVGKQSVKSLVKDTFGELQTVFEKEIVGREFDYRWKI